MELRPLVGRGRGAMPEFAGGAQTELILNADDIPTEKFSAPVLRFGSIKIQARCG